MLTSPIHEKRQKPNLEIFKSNELAKKGENLSGRLEEKGIKKKTSEKFLKEKNETSSIGAKRREIYYCMCIKLNTIFSSNSILKFFLNNLIASPIYVVTVLAVLVVAIAGSIVALSILNSQSTANKSYFANCSLSSDCDSLKGLQCSAQNGICNCPAFKTKGRCDCSKGYYWSGYECKRIMQYLDYGCTANFMCDKSKFLLCLNKACKCEPLKRFDTVSQTCKYNYLGCFYDMKPGVDSYVSSQLNQFYFVDICINQCKFKNTNYSIVYRWGTTGPTMCHCVNTLNFTAVMPNSWCDFICAGKNGEQYACGSSSGGKEKI